jgi:hypothetical protein
MSLLKCAYKDFYFIGYHGRAGLIVARRYGFHADWKYGKEAFMECFSILGMWFQRNILLQYSSIFFDELNKMTNPLLQPSES